MRILRLDLGGDIGTIDLHPFISVLHDFHPVQGAALINAIRSLVNGSGDGISGLVENAGHLVELSGDGADPIGPLTTEDILFSVDDLAVGDLGDPSVLEAELDQVRRAAQIDAVYVEEIRADLKPSVAAQVQRLRDQLDGLATDGKSAEVEALDRLKLAVEETSGVPPILREIPEEVEELISSWDNFVGIRDKAQPHIDELQQIVQRADAAFGRAQQELAEAKADAKPVLLTSEEDSRLEELAHPSVDRRGRSKAISPEEEAELQKLLAKVGVPTYTGYAMYRLNPTPSAEKMAELQLAEARVDGAQAELEEARAALEIDPVATDLNFEFDLVKAKAREHLGPMLPSDLGGALAKLVVETENPEYMEALRRLYDIAAAEDVPFPDNLEPRQLPEAVTNWVSHREAQMASGPSADPEQVEAALAKAEAALDRHARAMGRIDRLETKSLESAARVRELEDKIERVMAGTGMSADTVLSQVEPLIARIKEQNGTSVPILLAGDFTDLADSEIDTMMSQLELVAQDHQLIVLSDRRQAAVWAANAGLRRALRSTVVDNEDTHGIID